jgi:hypothetical protein
MVTLPVPLPVAETEVDGVALAETGGVCKGDSVVEGVIPSGTEGGGDADTVEVGLGDGVGVEDPVGEGVGVEAAVCEGVLGAENVPLGVALGGGVDDGDAPGDSKAVCEPVTVELPLAVVEGEGRGVPVGVGVGEGVALPVLVAVPVGLPVPDPVVEAEAGAGVPVPEPVGVGVLVPVPLPVGVTVGGGVLLSESGEAEGGAMSKALCQPEPKAAGKRTP